MPEPYKNTLTLPPLPYTVNALEPYISTQSLKFHYFNHHQGYLDKVNHLLQNSDLASSTLENIIAENNSGYSLDSIIFSDASNNQNYGLYLNAVLAWNHGFLWQSMKPDGGGRPTNQNILTEIEKSYDTYAHFRDVFIDIALQQSYGWVWLVKRHDRLKVVRTNYGDYPPLKQLQPLACLDLWEHAYYLDYQNRFRDYISTFIDHLINWNFVALNFTGQVRESG